MKFEEKITGALLRPTSAMKEIAEKPFIEEGLLLVGVYAVVSAAAAYIQTGKIAYEYLGFTESQIETMRSMTVIFGIVGALIGAVVIWIILTGIVHLLALAGGGEGKFYPQMLVVTGYGILPLLIAGILNIVILSQMDSYTITISASDPTAYREVMEAMKDDPYLQAVGLIGVLAWLWSAVLIFFGVKNAHRLTSSRAGLAISIPTAIIVTLTFGMKFLL